MPRHYTKDPGISASHVMDRVMLIVWRQTRNSKVADEIALQAYEDRLKGYIPQKLQPLIRNEKLRLKS